MTESEKGFAIFQLYKGLSHSAAASGSPIAIHGLGSENFGPWTMVQG